MSSNTGQVHSSKVVDTASLRLSGGWVRDRRETILAHGDDAVDFLQGQLSQDLAAMQLGQSLPSLLLEPNGKLTALVRVSRVGECEVIIDVDSGHSGAVMARLERFKLRTACDFDRLGWNNMTLFGPACSVDDEAELMVEDRWGDLVVRDLFGPSLSDPVEFWPLAAQVLRAVRIETGVPAMGAELDETTIPASAGIVEQSVSFTKGCYTGQELVARIDARGSNVPRRLVGLLIEGSGGLDATAIVASAGEQVGRLTSVGHSGMLGSQVAMAYLSRNVDLGDHLTVEGRSAEARDLPLIG